jgi:hypothetical protein
MADIEMGRVRAVVVVIASGSTLRSKLSVAVVAARVARAALTL